jgi:hypothetical protein
MIVGTPHGRRNPQFLGVHADLFSIKRAGISEVIADVGMQITWWGAGADNLVGRDSVEPCGWKERIASPAPRLALTSKEACSPFSPSSLPDELAVASSQLSFISPQA